MPEPTTTCELAAHVLLLPMISLAAAVIAAFNLVCHGSAWHSEKLLGAKQNEHQFEYVYRVDLSTGRYCVGVCTTTSQIKRVTDNLIIFEMEERNQLDDTVIYANRENGKYFDRVRHFLPPDFLKVDVAEGTCERAPFTGFPTRKF